MSSNKNTVMKSVKSTKAPKVTQTTVARCKVTAEIQGMLKHGPLGVEGAALQGHLLTNVLSAFGNVSEEELTDTLNIALALLHEIKPRNGIEALLATQMIHTHNLSITMMRRATHSEQTVDGVDRNVNRAAKLMRVFNSQLDALQKLRGKGQQKIIVEHVNVNEGGQAIVGDVSYQGGK